VALLFDKPCDAKEARGTAIYMPTNDRIMGKINSDIPDRQAIAWASGMNERIDDFVCEHDE
jgi:hypothetical protein